MANTLPSVDTSGVSGYFQKLDSKRQQHLNRARECAKYTIPSLLPPESADENTPLYTPYQGLGARAVNNLAAKLLLTLLPPNTPCFKFEVDPRLINQLKQELGEEGFKTQIKKQLGTVEMLVVKYFEAKAYRMPIFRALRLLIATGNALLEVASSGALKCHRLDKYVVRRNPEGKVVEIIIKETVRPDDLPPSVIPEKKPTEDQDIDLFTQVKLKGDKWYQVQFAFGKVIPGSEGNYLPHDMPFMPLAWTLADGENYGRGHVEEHLGDFISLDGLSQALLEGAAIASQVKYLVNPNGITSAVDLQRCVNGGFASGVPDDIHALQLEKMHDFKIAFDQAQEIRQQLAYAFLMHSSVQRQAERVTAEEIRFMAQELEDGLGGIFSVLGQELQKPLVTTVISRMMADNMIPPLPEGVGTTIITGFEALGRGHDLAKLKGFLGDIMVLGEETIHTWVIANDYITRVGTAYGVDTAGLVKSEEQVAQEQQQAQQMQQQQEMMKSPVAAQGMKAVMSEGPPQEGE